MKLEKRSWDLRTFGDNLFMGGVGRGGDVFLVHGWFYHAGHHLPELVFIYADIVVLGVSEGEVVAQLVELAYTQRDAQHVLAIYGARIWVAVPEVYQIGELGHAVSEPEAAAAIETEGAFGMSSVWWLGAVGNLVVVETVANTWVQIILIQRLQSSVKCVWKNLQKVKFLNERSKLRLTN